MGDLPDPLTPMTDLPNPMTPPDCDLCGFDWMALLGVRLFKSTFYRKARKDPRGGLAGIKLWWEAMMQKPAGSLPNDDEDLCMLADFGEDMKAWRKHRDVAMHGWVLCSDGRLYHPTVAEQAISAWEKKQKSKDKRDTDAERLRQWRARKNGHHPPDPGGGETLHETQDETRFETSHETRTETPKGPPETHVVGRKTVETVQDLESKKEREVKDLPSNIIPMSRAREEPSTAQRLGATTQIGRVTRALATTVGHAQGKKPQLDRWDQAKLLGSGPGPKHLTPEQLALARRAK